MTVEQLIEKLNQLPPQTPVMVEGYETGFDEIIDLSPRQIVKYRKAHDWDGEYQTVDQFSHTGSKKIEAVVIIGRRGHLR